MANLNGFNAATVEPSAGFDPVPAGKYLATIIKSEMKPTSKGDGKYLELTFQVMDGEYKNRQLWARLNLENKNAQAVQIARSELSSICRSVGVLTPKDSSDLHHLPLVISVKVKKRADTGDLTNEIAGYASKDGQKATVGTTAAAPTNNVAAAPAVSGPPATAPWKRPTINTVG